MPQARPALLLLLLLLPTAAGAEVVSLDLATAHARARAHARTLRDRDDELAAAGHRRLEALGRLGPRVTATARYSRLSFVEPAELELPISLPNQPPPEPITLGESIEDQWSLRLQLDQPVFVGFGLVAGLHAAEGLEEAARARRRAAEQELTVQVEESYLTALHARQLREVQVESVRLLERLLADVTRRREAGTAAVAEEARLKARLAGATLVLVQASTAAELAGEALASLLGLEPGTELALAEVPEAPAATVEPANDLVSRALRDRPELVAARALAVARRAQAEAAASARWPQLTLRAGASYDRPNARYFPAEDRFDPSWDVSLLGSWALWDWGVARNAARAAELDADVAGRSVEALADAVRLEVARRHGELAVEPTRLAAADAAVLAAELSLERAEQLCQSGASSCAIVLDAEAELTRSRADRLKVRADARLTRALLLRAIGGAP